jgi:hypothetical protein
MDAKKIEEQLKAEACKALEALKNLEHATETQVKDTYLASEILLSLTKGHEVSAEQITFLKDQSVNLGKALTLIGLQVVPGSSIAIVVLEKVVEKHGFTLFPRELKKPGMPGQEEIK